MIGKPYSGKLNVRFDEGELEIEPLPLRQLSTLPLSPSQNNLYAMIYTLCAMLGYGLWLEERTPEQLKGEGG